MSENQSASRKSLPNSFAVLLTGILSVLFSVLYGVPGLLLGIIALLLSRPGKRLRRQSPEGYTSGSWRVIVAGRVFATIGIILSLLIIGILAFAFFVLEVKWQPIMF